jgi:three prime repair exonuclease 1
MAEIKTLAFIDLETSGIPVFECYRSKITEIAIVACSKQHLLELKEGDNLPRVLHKLTLCLNPFKRINVQTTEVTGLDNYLLEEERQFDQSTIDLLVNFLDGLQKPTCLIAHNGLSFDYPILMKEILKSEPNLPSVLAELRCADSLELFRDIDDMQAERTKQELAQKRSEDEDVMAFVQKELDSIQAELENEQNGVVETTNKPSLDSEDEFISQFEGIEEVKDWKLFNESTPRRKPVPSNSRVARGGQKTAEPVTPETPKEKPKVEVERPTLSRKRLFDPPKSNRFKKGYKLTEIYERVYQQPPENLHRAEDDCMTLLKCVTSPKYKQDFIDNLEQQYVHFKDIEPIGFKI